MVATSTTPGNVVVGPATSQLQARLSQPPGNREQLRYLLQRGPNATAVASTEAGGQAQAPTAQIATTATVAAAAASGATGVTTTRVWVPGENIYRPSQATYNTEGSCVH